MERILISILLTAHRALRFVAVRVLPKHYTGGQFFANRMLRRYAPHFLGDIVNVSGWDDRDAEGGFYHDYFPEATSYSVTNAPTDGKGVGSIKPSHGITEIALDLEASLEPKMTKAYDLVLNVCTLEHIFDIETAFANLCTMSRDAVILVVPAIQQIHILDYGDYWRMTTLGVAKMFQKHGFTPLVIEANDQPFRPVFIFAIAVRDPEAYTGKIETSLRLQMGAALFGSSLKERYIDALLSRDVASKQE